MVPGVSWNLHPASNSRPLCTCAGQCNRPAGWTVMRPRRLNCRRWSQHTCHAQQDDNNNPGTLQDAAAAAAKAFGVPKSCSSHADSPESQFQKELRRRGISPDARGVVSGCVHASGAVRASGSSFTPMPSAIHLCYASVASFVDASLPAASADRQGATSTSDREQLPPAPGFADDRRQGADIPPQLLKSRQLQSEGLEVRRAC